MASEVRIYSRVDYGGEPQLEALVTSSGLMNAIRNGFVVQDRDAGIYRVTAAGEKAMNDDDNS